MDQKGASLGLDLPIRTLELPVPDFPLAVLCILGVLGELAAEEGGSAEGTRSAVEVGRQLSDMGATLRGKSLC